MTKAQMIHDIMTVLELDNPNISTGEKYAIRRRLQSLNETLVRREWREKVPEDMQYANYEY